MEAVEQFSFSELQILILTNASASLVQKEHLMDLNSLAGAIFCGVQP